jgi:hypothetical protein
MKKRWVWRVIFVLLLVAGLAMAIPTSRDVILGSLSGEPFFHGKPARYWNRTARGGTDLSRETEKELVAGGTAALPVALKMCAWDTKNSERGWILLQAIDERLTFQRDDFISALVESLQTKDKDIRLHAAYYLVRTTQSPMRPTATPVVVESLKSQDERSRFYAVETLRMLGDSLPCFPQEGRDTIKSAAPALIAALADTSPRVQQIAAKALSTIDPEAAVKVGVNPEK